MNENERPETPEEQPADATPPEEAPEAAADAQEPAPDAQEPAADAPAAQDAPAETPETAEAAEAETSEAPEAEAPEPPEAAPAGERRPSRASPPDAAGEPAEEVVPGADLEPDLVLDDRSQEEDRYAEAAERYPDQAAPVAEEAPAATEEPAAATPMTLAADARYAATGKRKTSVARVILSPGDGSYTINGRPLEEFFPRPTLQVTARQPLATAGYDERMNVVAKLHGGGVSAQAGALRHGIARALVEADPNLRGELKRRGFLTRDPRVKERKKAGLKKARKRPQFSKR